MGFLKKISKKHKDSKITPPPPPPREPDSSTDEKSTELPEVDSPMPSMPELKPLPNLQKTPPPKLEPLTKPEEPMDNPMPNLPPPLTTPSSDEVRTMGDLPPIKLDEEPKSVITNEHVKELDVDKFVLPGEDQEETTSIFEEQPAPKQVIAPQPSEGEDKGFSGPLYVDVKTYEDVQKLVDDLKGQLSQVRDDITAITKYRDKEDKEFAKVIAKLEKVQDDLLKVDEDLFEEK